MICASSTGDSLIFGEVKLHWLDVVDRVRFRVCVQVFRCLHIRWLLNTCLPITISSPAIGWPWPSRLSTPVKLASYGGRSFHTLALRIGTHFHLLTIVFFFHLLSATPKPFSSLSTRLAHAVRFGFFYKNTLYKFTVIIIIIIIYASEHAEGGLQTIWLQSIKHRRRSREGPQVRTLTIIWLWVSSMAWTLTIIWLHYRISIVTKVRLYCATRRPQRSFTLKMHQNRWRLGLRPRPIGSAPLDPLAWLRGPISSS